MMPGVGFEEMILLVVVAIIVVGPKDLPLMMRKFGRFTGKMRAMAFEFKQGLDELGRQAELDELRKEVANLKAHTGLDDVKRDLEETKAEFERDVRASTAPIPAATHPAISQASKPAAYAGLSADHPGYDTGDGNQIGGGVAPQDDDNAPPASAKGEGVNGVHVNGEKAGDPHVIPDDEVAPAAPKTIKQDTPA